MRYLIVLLIVLMPYSGWSWGAIGHRVIGKIAEKHLTKKARKRIQRVLGTESLAEVSTWMDFVRSDDAYRFMSTWHYVSIDDGQSYEDINPPENGDVIAVIERLISELERKEFSREDEAFALKCLVHLVGDVHQPLHVGRTDDRGGNRVNVKWFGEESNLHRVWDSQIIDHQQYSYSELTEVVNHATKTQIQSWQANSVRDWAQESMAYRNSVYDLPDDAYLSYRYIFDHIGMVKQRLLQAGIRLAGILNAVYG